MIWHYLIQQNLVCGCAFAFRQLFSLFCSSFALYKTVLCVWERERAKIENLHQNLKTISICFWLTCSELASCVICMWNYNMNVYNTFHYSFDIDSTNRKGLSEQKNLGNQLKHVTYMQKIHTIEIVRECFWAYLRTRLWIQFTNYIYALAVTTSPAAN